MSQRKKTAPSTLKHPRSSPSSRKGLIATEKTKKQSAKKRTVLDNRFHRTYHAFSRERPPRAEAEASRRLPRLTMQSEGASCSRRDAVKLAMNEALQRRA